MVCFFHTFSNSCNCFSVLRLLTNQYLAPFYAHLLLVLLHTVCVYSNFHWRKCYLKLRYWLLAVFVYKCVNRVRIFYTSAAFNKILTQSENSAIDEGSFDIAFLLSGISLNVPQEKKNCSVLIFSCKNRIQLDGNTVKFSADQSFQKRSLEVEHNYFIFRVWQCFTSMEINWNV